MIEVAQGDTFVLGVEHGSVAVVRVFRRQDLALACNNRGANAMVEALLALRDDPRHQLRGLILDMDEASLPGPNSQEALREVLCAWCAEGYRVAVVADHPTMRMIFGRLLAHLDAEHAQLLTSMREAQLWAAGVSLDALQAAGGEASQSGVLRRRGGRSVTGEQGERAIGWLGRKAR